jgi:hypothetical protein
MIDMTLAELLTGLDLSEDPIEVELEPTKEGPKPEGKPEGEEKPKQR